MIGADLRIKGVHRTMKGEQEVYHVAIDQPDKKRPWMLRELRRGHRTRYDALIYYQRVEDRLRRRRIMLGLV